MIEDNKTVIDKHDSIEVQVERWDMWAKVFPTIFLLIMLGLTVWGWITLDTAFYIGLGFITLTSVIWWFWTIYTIRYLVRVLNRAATNLGEVRAEFKSVARDVERLNNEDD
jgi:hypothetical protein|tara:strand:- start:148 stop:480 length:333 start_codon:yes stop_codon:yes gene_type:complete